MSDRIIVTGRPFAVFQQNDFYNLPAGGNPAGAAVLAGQLVANDMMSKKNVTVDEDVNTPEIVVVATNLKGDLARVAVQAAISAGASQSVSIPIPCIGPVSFREISGNAKNMTFNLNSKNYGNGRAGENLAGSSGNSVPIKMNANSALDYSKLTNGLMYLVTHEIAHSLHAMQVYDNQQWQKFVARSAPGQTKEQLVAAYPNSPEFAANEQRANRVAKAIAENLGFGAMSPDPTHGYAVC